jgi:predicted O-methyltransferase YrrM
LPFETKRILSISNIEVGLAHPRVLIGLVTGGKIGALQFILTDILSGLSDSNEETIRRGLDHSLDTHEIVLPERLQVFNKSFELTNLVMLYYLIRLNRPRLAIETGVWTGKSSWFILQAMSDNDQGNLLSIDLGRKTIDESVLPVKEVGDLVPAGLRKRWNLVIGDARDVLPDLSREKKWDFFYHDSNHSYDHMKWEFDVALKGMTRGGILASDDISANAAFAQVSVGLDKAATVGGRFGYGFSR